MLETFKIFRLDRVQAESHGYYDKDTLVFSNLFSDLVQENVAIRADNHAEIRKGLHSFIDLVQNVADRLRAIPITRLPTVSETDLGNAVDAKWTDMVILYVVHEEAQDAIVLVELHPFVLVH